MDDINDMLEVVKEYGFLTEVIVSAIEDAKNNPEDPLEEIFYRACAEWDCV